MPEVLLTHSNHVYFDRKQTEKMQPWPPLQTLIAAAVLRERGIDTAVFDPTFDAPEQGFLQALETYHPRLVVVCEDDFNFLSKMCLTRNRELAFWMARECGRRNIPAVAHGSDASDHAGEYLAAGFSSVLVGEVEATLLELAESGNHRAIHGIVYAENGSITRNPSRHPAVDMDRLPLPARDLVDIDQYRRAWRTRHGYFAMNAVSSRGCPYQCNWCAKPIYGHSYRRRSAWSMASELRHLKTEYQPDRLWFADDIFALSARWTREFAEAVDRLDARISFKMQSRCDLMTLPTVAALREAGCDEVWMGAESGSQKILDAMDKGLRIEQIHKACDNLRRHEIRVCLFLQFGYPGEEWDEIEATIRMVREVRPDDIGISVSYPLPGTRFHQIVAGQLGAKSNWSDSADLSMMFRGAYSTAFYRALAEALHAEVRGGKTIGDWTAILEAHHPQTRAEVPA